VEREGVVDERRSTRKTWISVVIAAIIVVGMLAATAVGGTAYFFYHHIHTQTAESGDAAKEFAAARERFAGQPPLIEMRRGDEPLLHRELIKSGGAGRPLESLRVLAYDPDDAKLVNVSIPFWLLRLAPTNKRMSFLSDNGIDFDSERVHLTLEDLERRGPGLVLDHKDRRGSLVLVWTE
jgi:hypothetical protein